MSRALFLALAWLAIFEANSARADVKDLEGTWKVVVYQTSNAFTDMVVRIDAKDPSAVAVTVLDGLLARSKDLKTDVKLADGRLVISMDGLVQFNPKFKASKLTRTLDIAIPEKRATLVRGTYLASPVFAIPMELVATDDEKLPSPATRSVPYQGEAFKKLLAGQRNVSSIFVKISQEKDKENKQELQKQRARAEEEFKQLAPGLHREIVNADPKAVPALFSAMAILTDLKSSKPTVDEVQKLASVCEAISAPFGPRLVKKTTTDIAKALYNHDEFAPIAIAYVRKLQKSLPADATLEQKSEVLSMLATSLRKGKGSATELANVEKSVAEMGKELDAEYRNKVSAFKVSPGARRTDASKRPVLMELFTGAQCPPCVAADVAFDLLPKAYQADDVILLQYHVHIPGPDPLTNSETMARFESYADAFPEQVRGAPSSLFNGKPAAGGGGPFDAGGKKLDAYREVIDPLLEATAEANLQVKASAKGEMIEIVANVSQVKKTGDKMKLRLVLVEELVHYTGSNKVRLHHQVVRAFAGGLKGYTLTSPQGEFKASVDLSELRKNLTAHLDEYGGKRSFSNASRPMEMAHLRVVAFIQDDANQEVLNAVQVYVEGRK